MNLFRGNKMATTWDKDYLKNMSVAKEKENGGTN